MKIKDALGGSLTIATTLLNGNRHVLLNDHFLSREQAAELRDRLQRWLEGAGDFSDPHWVARVGTWLGRVAALAWQASVMAVVFTLVTWLLNGGQ